jgi:hypothetical protein
MRVITSDDLEKLIEIVGVEGATAALRATTLASTDALRQLAKTKGLYVSAKTGRHELIDTLVAPDAHRIQRPISELAQLSEVQIAGYLTKANCTSLELMRYMDVANVPYDKGLTRKALIGHAAREISRLGVFQRISGGEGERPTERDLPSSTDRNISEKS